jgi:hypothetical protein
MNPAGYVFDIMNAQQNKIKSLQKKKIWKSMFQPN